MAFNLQESFAFERLQARLQNEMHTWLITGVAGFIGSNLLETLLRLNQRVVGLDNFVTGHEYNLDEVRSCVTAQQWGNFRFLNGDIRNLESCREAMTFKNGVRSHPVQHVLHQAALGSVPRSVADPVTTNSTNISGFLNMLIASRDAEVKSFTYAASSSTYGDHPGLPKIEDTIGKPLSPYAVTKYVNEVYADVFFRCYGFNSIGLRYFNVFGKRQDPSGAYAAVIPKWISAMMQNQNVTINGDGETSRDFCYIENTVQANLLAALTVDARSLNQVYNVAAGGRTTLNQLFQAIRDSLNISGISYDKTPVCQDFRAGDVRHSQANIEKAQRLIGYRPVFDMRSGLHQTIEWYLTHTSKS